MATFVQSAGANNSTAPAAIAFSGAVTTGNAIIVCGCTFGSSSSFPTVTDNHGNTYKQLMTHSDGNNSAFLYMATGVAGGVSLTVTLTGGALSSGYGIGIHEYNGVIAMDQFIVAIGNSNHISPGAIPTSGASHEMLFAFGGQGANNNTATVSSPFVLRVDEPDGSTWESCYTADDVTNAGSTPTFTTAGSTNWVAVGASFLSSNSYPRTDTVTCTPNGANSWNYTNAGDPTLTDVTFHASAASPCNLFRITGHLADTTAFDIPTATCGTPPLQWTFTSFRISATAYEGPIASPLTVAVVSNQNQLTWVPATGANNNYNIYRSDTPGNETLLASNQTSPYNDNTLMSFYYQVGGVNGPVVGDLSTEQYQNNGISSANSANVLQWLAVAVQSDDKFVVVGQGFQGTVTTSPNIVMARYNSNGSIDTGFGTGGFVTLIEGYNTVGTGVAIQTDGKIVITGYDYSAATRIIIARYTTAGALDATFGTGGVVQQNVSTFGATSSGGVANYKRTAVAIDSTGNIYITSPLVVGGNFELVLARYTSAGVLDTGFNGTGFIVSALGTGGCYPVAIKLQPSDGKILVGGFDHQTTTPEFLLARYNTTGTLDTSVTTSISYGNAHIASIDVDSGNNIIVVGAGTTVANRFTIARYTSALALDGTFGTGGITIFDFGGGTSHYSEAFAVVALSTGKYLAVGGETALGGVSPVPLHLALARFTSAGAVESTITYIYDVATEALAAGLQSTGEIVAAGFNDPASPGHGYGIAALISPGF